MPEVAPTPQIVEQLSFPKETPFIEAAAAMHHSLLYRGNEVNQARQQKKLKEEDMTQAQKNLGAYAFFSSQKEPVSTPTPLFKDDESSAMRIVVTVENGQLVPTSFLKKGDKAENLPKDAQVMILKASNGKKDNNYHFTTTQGELVAIDEQTFRLLFAYTYQDELIGASAGSESAVAKAVCSQILDPTKKFDIDPKILTEGVKASGQISTEPIVTCVKSKMPRKDIPKAPAVDASADDVELFEAKKLQAEAYNAKLDTLVSELENHAIATPDDLSGLMTLFGENELRDGIDVSFQRISELRGKLNLTTDAELRKGYEEEIKAAESNIKDYQKALETIVDPKKLTILFDFIESGKLSPKAAGEINDLIAGGKVGDAMKKMAQENLASMSEEEKKKIAKFLGKDVKEIEKALMTAGGAGLILLLLLIITGAGGPKG